MAVNKIIAVNQRYLLYLLYKIHKNKYISVMAWECSGRERITLELTMVKIIYSIFRRIPSKLDNAYSMQFHNWEGSFEWYIVSYEILLIITICNHFWNNMRPKSKQLRFYDLNRYIKLHFSLISFISLSTSINASTHIVSKIKKRW